MWINFIFYYLHIYYLHHVSAFVFLSVKQTGLMALNPEKNGKIKFLKNVDFGRFKLTQTVVSYGQCTWGCTKLMVFKLAKNLST